MVGDEGSSVGGHVEERVRSREAGEIPDVDERGDEQGLLEIFEQATQTPGVVHCSHDPRVRPSLETDRRERNAKGSVVHGSQNWLSDILEENHSKARIVAFLVEIHQKPNLGDLHSRRSHR